MDCVKRELPKAEVSEFILTVDSRGCVSEDLTLWEDYTPEVCVGEHVEIPEARSPEVICSHRFVGDTRR
jgi:hypothetical protein